MRNDTQFYYFVDSYSNLWFIPPMIIKCDCMIFKFEYHNHKFIFSTLTCVALFFFRSPIHLLPYSEIYIQTFLGLPWRLLPVIQELPPTKKVKHSGGITIRCPNHLNWLLLTQGRSTPGSIQMSELLIPSEMWVKPPCKLNSFWLLVSFLVQP